VYQGATTGELGNWEPLVTGDVFDLIQAQLADPRRVSNRAGTDRKHLGSGLFLCAVCDAPTSSFSQGRYRCKARHVNRSRGPVDDRVLRVIAARLDREDAAQLLAPTEAGLAPLLDERKHLSDQLALADADYDRGFIDGQRFASRTAHLRAEIQAVERQMAAFAVADSTKLDGISRTVGAVEPQCEVASRCKNIVC
jgi:site-specific DNA recombinase